MKKTEIAGLALIGLLFFIWPISHTVSLRQSFLAMNLVLFGYIYWRQKLGHKNLSALYVAMGSLLALTAWMYVVAFLMTSETSWSLSEIQSQWWWAVAALMVGGLGGLQARHSPRLLQVLLLVLFVALLLHVVYVDFEMAINLWGSGPLERVSGLTEGPDKSNYLTNILFGFLLTEIFCRTVYRQRVLPISMKLLIVVLMLTAISVFAERMRNGMATLVLMLLVLGSLYLIEQRTRLKKTTALIFVSLLLAMLLGGLGFAATLRGPTSLKNIIDTIPVAWDTEHNKAWQDEKKYGLPTLADGESVDTTAYMRIAWLKQGLLLVADHPFGIGFGRNAYGHGMKAKYGEGAGHSHSGLLDLTIGIGIPGSFLWLAFLFSLWLLAWRYYRLAAPNYAAVLLMLLLVDFGARMLVDSVIRDHMLQQFMFLMGLTAVMAVTNNSRKTKITS